MGNKREATIAFPDNTLYSTSAQDGEITTKQFYSKTAVEERNINMVSQLFLKYCCKRAILRQYHLNPAKHYRKKMEKKITSPSDTH